MSISINHNGKLTDASKPVIPAGNRGLKYGDGLFETMKLNRGKARFQDYHFDRLFSGMRLLGFDLPPWMNADYFSEQIMMLAKKNHHLDAAKARLMIYRGSGGLYEHDHQPNFLIETTVLPPVIHIQSDSSNGLNIGIYPDARKTTDCFASLKTNNFLPYAMAAIYAKKNSLDDCLLLNVHDRICDSTISNVFFVHETKIITPALSEGCIAGVMRRYLLSELPKLGFEVIEKEVTREEAESADEIFLTNAVQGIRIVKKFQHKHYNAHTTRLIRNSLFKEIG